MVINHSQLTELRRILELIRKDLIPLIDPMGMPGLTGAQCRVILIIGDSRKRISATDVADRLGMDPGHLSRILQDLRRKRLVFREQSARDAKQYFLHLTPEGARMYAELEANIAGQLLDRFERFSSPQRHDLIGCLRTAEMVLLRRCSSGLQGAAQRAR